MSKAKKFVEYINEEIKKGRRKFDIGLTPDMKIDDDSENRIKFVIQKKSELLKGFSLWHEETKIGTILSHYIGKNGINTIVFKKRMFGEKQLLKFTDNDNVIIENGKVIFKIGKQRRGMNASATHAKC